MVGHQNICPQFPWGTNNVRQMCQMQQKGPAQKPQGGLVLPAVNPPFGHGLTVDILTEPRFSARMVEHVQR